MAAAAPGAHLEHRIARVVAGSGPRLVLVHGFTQSARSWAGLQQLLTARHEVVAVDLPGHGSSSSCEVTGLEESARLLGASGGRASYVGYSLGGRTALTLALSSPELVERLVLVATTAGIDDDEERRQRRSADEALAQRIEDGGREGLEAFLAEWLAGPLFSHLDAGAADLEARRANTPEGLAASLRSCGTGTQVPSWEALGSLTMPVLVVAGALDEKFAALAQRLVEAIGANAALALVAGSGHAVPFEAPGGFVDALESFLDESAGSTTT